MLEDLSHSFWSPEEEAFLKENYDRMSTKALSEKLRRSPVAIRQKASRLRLPKNLINWEENEEKYLLENYHKKSYTQMAKHLNRSASAIRNKSYKMGLKRKKWRKEEEEFLLSLLGEYPWNSIESKYNRWAKEKGYPSKKEESLKRKVRYLRASIRLDNSSSYLGVRDIQLLLGCDKMTVYRFQKIYPELKKVKGGEGRDRVCFSRKTIKKWLANNQEVLERYQEKLNIRWLVDILS